MIGLLQSYFRSRRKSRRLRNVSLVLGAGLVPLTPHELLQFNDHITAAEDCLFDIIEDDGNLVSILDYYEIGRTALRRTYRGLCASGADEWAGGHWVPASALAFATTLPFILAKTDCGKLKDYDAWLLLGSDLVNYFRNGRIGQLRG